MKLAIMQPYFFPYLGYFQLINHVDKFVFYDDVNFIKGGWINRNRIIVNREPHYINAEMSNASPNKKIKEIELNSHASWRHKTIRKIELNYSKAVHFKEVFETIVDIINFDTNSLSEYAKKSVISICLGLKVETKLIHTSTSYENDNLNAYHRVLDICKREQADSYTNPVGGIELYDKQMFNGHGLNLDFISSNAIVYKQFADQFYPNMSIIDMLMHCGWERTGEYLLEYKLI